MAERESEASEMARQVLRAEAEWRGWKAITPLRAAVVAKVRTLAGPDGRTGTDGR